MKNMYIDLDTNAISTIRTMNRVRITPIEIAFIERLEAHGLTWKIMFIEEKEEHFLMIPLNRNLAGFALGTSLLNNYRTRLDPSNLHADQPLLTVFEKKEDHLGHLDWSPIASDLDFADLLAKMAVLPIDL